MARRAPRGGIIIDGQYYPGGCNLPEPTEPVPPEVAERIDEAWNSVCISNPALRKKRFEEPFREPEPPRHQPSPQKEFDFADDAMHVYIAPCEGCVVVRLPSQADGMMVDAVIVRPGEDWEGIPYDELRQLEAGLHDVDSLLKGR